MRCVKNLLVLFSLLAMAACSGATGSDGTSSTFEIYGPLRHKSGLHWTFFITGNFSGPVPEVVEVVVEEAVEEAASTAQGHVLLTGVISQNSFSSGQFLIETRGTKSCGDQVCADQDGAPTASKILAQPNYFALVVPKGDQALYLVVTYTDDKGENTSKEIYLGVLDGRVDNLDLDFSPEEEPTPPGGPTDLTS